ncbi:porphobilinogen deaminase [Plectosphaerella cucumerina]|uniref:Porphobilinogen deaminase n=1 Tax=Plectosphaerella cucumerina TaxID=40658 RepID=A0A8K0X6F9_9PEZI|nr:porphobilinogen deaminase [Plectosphaerella cucumerina]
MADTTSSSAGTAAAATPANTINIGTRKSALAVRQTELVIESLQRLRPDLHYEIHAMQTLGDKDQVTALYNFGGKGLWTNELEARLGAGELDMIVHCLKDMPTTLPQGCVIGAVSEREDPRDVVVVKASLAAEYKSLADLPAGSVIGTSSIRRIAQLRRIYPDLRFQDVRGNIQTRLRKLDDEEGPFSAIILAAAGLLRMDYGDRISHYLDSSTGGILYAVGQGALCLEAREGDERVLSLLRGFDHATTRLACEAERSIMRTLEGGCSVPIGVETSWVGSPEDRTLRLKATVVHVNGQDAVLGELTAPVHSAEDADALGKALAKDLVDRGAQTILDDVNKTRAAAAAAAAEKAAGATTTAAA